MFLLDLLLLLLLTYPYTGYSQSYYDEPHFVLICNDDESNLQL